MLVINSMQTAAMLYESECYGRHFVFMYAVIAKYSANCSFESCTHTINANGGIESNSGYLHKGSH